MHAFAELNPICHLLALLGGATIVVVNKLRVNIRIKIPSKNMCEKSTNTPIIHSVYKLCMVAPTRFGITLPSSGSVPSAF